MLKTNYTQSLAVLCRFGTSTANACFPPDVLAFSSLIWRAAASLCVPHRLLIYFSFTPRLRYSLCTSSASLSKGVWEESLWRLGIWKRLFYHHGWWIVCTECYLGIFICLQNFEGLMSRSRFLGLWLLLKSETILSPDSLYVTCLLLLFPQDSYRLFALSLMFWNSVPMCHGLDPVWIHVRGPFRLDTSGFISGIFSHEHQYFFDYLSPRLFHYPLSGTLIVAHVRSLALTLIVFIFLYLFPCLCFALFRGTFF